MAEHSNLFNDIEEEILRTEKINLILQEHNKYRSKHRSPALQLDDEMTFKAEQWSEHSLNIGILTNKPNNEFGENLWHRENTSLNDLMMSDEMNPVKFWYDQIKFYSGYYISHPDEYSGDFTQLVWRSSQKLGVGIGTKDKIIYVVCFYYPPGNIIGINEFDTDQIYRINVLYNKGASWNKSDRFFNDYFNIFLTTSVLIYKFHIQI
ncbi:hypothetical protein PGB90_010177 [Kerria lacca]